MQFCCSAVLLPTRRPKEGDSGEWYLILALGHALPLGRGSYGVADELPGGVRKDKSSVSMGDTNGQNFFGRSATSHTDKFDCSIKSYRSRPTISLPIVSNVLRGGGEGSGEVRLTQAFFSTELFAFWSDHLSPRSH